MTWISIHPPRAGWDKCGGKNSRYLLHFNPPTPCGVGQYYPIGRCYKVAYFNPPTPCGVGHILVDWPFGWKNFNPPTPCGVGLFLRKPFIGSSIISIHPPRAGWDCRQHRPFSRKELFQSTHPVRGGTDIYISPACMYIFQSTHPVRGGTLYCQTARHSALFQSTHPVRGGTQCRDTAV